MPGRRSKVPIIEPESIEYEPMEISATLVAHDAVPRITTALKGSQKTPAKKSSSKRTAVEPVVPEANVEMDENSSDDELSDSEQNTENNDAYSFHERYFEGSKKSKTSNNTLSMDKVALQRKVEEINERALARMG